MNYLQDPLWQRIESFEMDEPLADFPFSKKLAKENNWTPSFARKAILEYKRFIYLCCISAQGASPSKIVDEIWHLHLTYTVSYWKVFCQQILQRELHHFPSKGGAQETTKYDQLYRDTLTLYETTFGQTPPSDCWSQAIDQKPVMQLNGIKVEADLKYYLVFVIPFVFIELMFDKWNPYKLTGPQFLGFMMMMIICVGIYMVLKFNEQIKHISNMLLDSIVEKDAYETAYLSKGKRAYQQMVLIDLIEQQKIHLINKSFYSIHRDQLMNTWNPLNHFLMEFEADTIELNEIMSEAYFQASKLDTTYPELSNNRSFDVMFYMPVAATVLISIIRIVQGMSQDRPVSMLVEMMFLFVLCANMAVRYFKSRLRNDEIITLNDESMSHISSDAQRSFLLSGTSALVMLPLFYHLHDQPYFAQQPRNTNNWGSGSDSGGGCGSDGGGDGGDGCGGGCGGCGGGD